MVGGAVNDTILLDTGANVSIISERFVKKLRLRAVPNHGRSIDIQGIGKGALTTKRRVLVKVTLERRLVYEFEMWVLPHNARVDVVLGMDFMIPAGSKKMEANPVGRREVPCRSPRGLRVEAHGCADFSLQKNRPPAETHVLWVRRTEKLISTLLPNRRGDLAKDPTLLGLEREHYERWSAAQPSLVNRPVYTTPTNILRRPSDDSGHGLTLRDGRAKEASGTSDADDSSVTVGVGATTEVVGDDSDGDDDGDDVSNTCDALDDTEAATEGFETCSSDVANGSYVNCDVSDPAETNLGHMVVNAHVTSREPSLSGDEDPRTRPKRREAITMVLSMDPDAVAELDAMFVSAMRVSVAEETQGPAEGDATYEHPAADTGLEDYAHELAFLPDLTETSPTTLDYSAPNVQGDEHTSDEQSLPRHSHALTMHKGHY
ncbi:hypothetical protein PC115_g11777 [Phytophthora cactorum]|uniref:Peptidase A2 domain-containing protein n=2 Tax=Phytophthora cactorum TaxID=29920 RepID=A0A8T1C3F4_9STRA|nr:hypothetical protein PC115_g11777 [Phytophthora cactorum]